MAVGRETATAGALEKKLLTAQSSRAGEAKVGPWVGGLRGLPLALTAHLERHTKPTSLPLANVAWLG
eukprot:3129849-Pyramimonas_sp.AAC.1